MRIKAIIAFTDKQAKAPEDAHVPEGKEFTVTAERGAELVGLGLAVELDGAPPSSRKPRKTAEPIPVPDTRPVIADPPAPDRPAIDQEDQ